MRYDKTNNSISYFANPIYTVNRNDLQSSMKTGKNFPDRTTVFFILGGMFGSIRRRMKLNPSRLIF